MSIKIVVQDEIVFLEYSPENGTDWIQKIFDKNEGFRAKGTFRLSKDELHINENKKTEEEKALDSLYETTKIFKIGKLDGSFYSISKKVLDTTSDILFHTSCRLSLKYFIVNSNMSILLRFEKLANQQIIIGGDDENSIPEQVFNDIIDSFPSKTEQRHYVDSRITNVLSQYLEGVKDSGKAFEKYLENRNKIGNLSTIPSIKGYEFEKYQFIIDTLKSMLDESDSYSENDWQIQILEIILILYPKYIRCFSGVQIKDYYTNPNKSTNRFIDLMLVDSIGNVDVIEIKKPFSNCIITKGTYRDNHTPLKELSGTIMQIEKYIFHFNKWGVNGERTLTKNYKSELPNNLDIKITNPKGMIILGRTKNLTARQLFDLEIVKRKYSNVMDIITYDDLIERLENIMGKFQN
ncbi:MAG: DUF4263 domain-containing protein [Cyclobacteriaceae bacterium]